jgi:hypothetical protein
LCRLLFLLKCDAGNRVPFHDFIDDLQRRRDAEHRVLKVEAGVVDQVDKQLRVPGVSSARGQSDRPALVRHGADLVAHIEAIARILIRPRTASLDDEIRHDAMEREAVVIARGCKANESRHRERRQVTAQADGKGLAALEAYSGWLG